MTNIENILQVAFMQKIVSVVSSYLIAHLLVSPFRKSDIDSPNGAGSLKDTSGSQVTSTLQAFIDVSTTFRRIWRGVGFYKKQEFMQCNKAQFIWTNQNTELFVNQWLLAHATFNVTFIPAFCLSIGLHFTRSVVTLNIVLTHCLKWRPMIWQCRHAHATNCYKCV